MITNNRQLAITKSQLGTLNREIALQVAVESHQDDFSTLYVCQLRAQRNRLAEQIKDYEDLASGLYSVIPVGSLGDLPLGLIKARIARGLSQKDLGDRVGVKEQQIQRYESQFYATASFSRLLEIAAALGVHVMPSVMLEAEGKAAEIELPSSLRNLLPSLPVEEMYKRGWFKTFRGTSKEARLNSLSLLEEHFAGVIDAELVALNRKSVRVDKDADSCSLLAWLLQAMKVAPKPLRSFDANILTRSWFNGLVTLSVREDGPKLVKDYLQEVGVSFVILPHLPKTYLDGAAISSPGQNPIVGVTLRHDRLDNFWFVLLHELAHVKLHLSEHSAFFDDCDISGEGLESEADIFAGEALLPSPLWEVSVARYLQSKSAVMALASEINIHPAIIAGRIRKESGNYLILNELVGSGAVRRLFPDVQFTN